MNLISITMAYGEKGPRSDALQAYLMDHPKDYDFAFGDVEVDLVFSVDGGSDLVIRRDFPAAGCHAESIVMPRKCRAVELKMPADFVQSLQNGHLSQQRRQCPHPLQVAVLGSLGDVLRAFGKVGPNGPWTQKEIKSNFDFINRGVSKLRASGVDVAFGWSPLDWLVDWSMGFKAANLEAAEEMALEANMAQVVREARAYLEGDIHLPRAKCESVQEAMMMCLPGVGPERARAMLGAEIRPELVSYRHGLLRFGVNIPREDYRERDIEELCRVPGIGKKTAERILEAMR